MRKRILVLLVIVLVLSWLRAAKLDQYQILAYRVKPAVVRVVAVVLVNFSYLDANSVKRDDYIVLGGTGSGFIFHQEGYIVTNGHVIYNVFYYENDPEAFIGSITPALVERLMQREGLEQPSATARSRWLESRGFAVSSHNKYKRVILSNGEAVEFEIKRFSKDIDVDEGGKDVGILKIERDNLPVVLIGDSSKVEIQEEIQTFGFPGAADIEGVKSYYQDPKRRMEVSINRGRISSKKQDYRGVPLIQTDAVIARGSSGGPAINGRGEVIGITTYMGGELGPNGQFTQVQGINFIIPSNTVMEFIREVGVDLKRGSQFNDIYYAALDAVWNEDWFKARDKVDDALRVFNGSPDLIELQKKIAIEISNMSALEKIWKQNRLVLLIGVLILLLTVVFVLLLLRTRRGGATLEREMEAVKNEILADSREPIPAGGNAAKVADQTLVLFGNVDLIIDDAKEGRYPVSERPVVVGRDPTRANILVQDPIISKVHCTFFVRDGTVWLRDNDSTNGTFIGDARISEEMLKGNELISLGRKGSIKLLFTK